MGVLDNPFEDNLMEVVNSLDAKILEEETWADLETIFERVFVKDGPLFENHQVGETLRRYIEGD